MDAARQNSRNRPAERLAVIHSEGWLQQFRQRNDVAFSYRSKEVTLGAYLTRVAADSKIDSVREFAKIVTKLPEFGAIGSSKASYPPIQVIIPLKSLPREATALVYSMESSNPNEWVTSRFTVGKLANVNLTRRRSILRKDGTTVWTDDPMPIDDITLLVVDKQGKPLLQYSRAKVVTTAELKNATVSFIDV